MNPYKVDLSQFTEKIIDKASFTIRNVSDKELKLKLVGSPSDFFNVKLPKSVGAGKSVKGEIILTDKAKETSFAKSVTIELDDETTTRFTLPIKRAYSSPKVKKPDLSKK